MEYYILYLKIFIIYIIKMKTSYIIYFSSIYLLIKFLLYMIIMPNINKKKYIEQLSKKSKEHYSNVRNNRKNKGIISIITGLILGFITYLLLKDKTNSLELIFSTIFICVGSINIMYEILWQDKFIFEEKDISRITKDNNIDNEELVDIKNYSLIYKKTRYISNIIELVSVLASLIIFYFLIILKKI